MTTAYTSLLGLALPVTGELSGTWGDTVNNSITSLLDSAVAGTTNLSTDADVTLTTTTGAANTAREAILLFSGARTALRTITAPAQSKIYTVINATTGGYSVKLVGVGPTTGVTIIAGESAVCAWNGSDFIKISNTSGAGVFSSITNTGLTSGRLVFSSTGGLEADSASLTWDGTTLSSTQVNITGQGTLRLQDTTGGEYVGLRSPSALGASYTLTFPADDGTSGQALITDGSGVLSWSTAASGDVYGPASATDNAVARFDLTTGKIIQNSVVIVGDTGDVSGVGTLSAATLTLTNALGTAYGGTGLTSFTSGGVVYASSTSALATGSALTFDGTTLAITGPVSSTRAGTANYVLNDSSSSTSSSLQANSSALYFNANTGAVGAGSFIWRSSSALSELMRLTSTLLYTASTVNIAIGASSGTSGTRLTIQESAANSAALSLINRNNTQNWKIAVDGVSVDDKLLAFIDNGTSQIRMALTDTGNLGIGTSSPTAKLHVESAVGYIGTFSENSANKVRFQVYVDANEVALTSRYDTTAKPMTFYTAGAKVATLDISGNLGLGVTPSAWATYRAMQLGAGGAVWGHQSTASEVYLTSNQYYNAGNKFIGTGYAAQYGQAAGAHYWFTSTASGTAGTAITFTQAMTLDASGNLGLGVQPSAWESSSALQMGSTAATNYGYSKRGVLQNAYYDGSLFKYFGTGGATYYQPFNGSHVWATAASGTAGNTATFSTTMTLNASGNLIVGGTVATGARGRFYQDAAPSSSGDMATGLQLSASSGAQAIAIGASTGDYTWIQSAYSNNAAVSAASLRFYMGATERMRLDSAGNVGIGVTNPSTYGKLAIDGTPYFYNSSNQQIRLGSNDGASYYTLGRDNVTTGNFIVTRAGTTIYTVDTSGNFGLGVTPSAWVSTYKAFELFSSGCGVSSDAATKIQLAANFYRVSGADKYGTTGEATLYSQASGVHKWFNAPSGTAGTNISFTQAMTLDASGNLGVGTTSPASRLHILQANGAASTIEGTATNSRAYNYYKSVDASSAALTAVVGTFGDASRFDVRVETAHPIIFGTTNTERMRIPAAGGVQAKTTISVGDATPSTSGAGITFPATQSASSDANTLDDYEEGTWTPTFSGTVVGTLTLTGLYTKIGRVVYWQALLSSTGSTTSVRDVSFIQGFPFVTTNNGNTFGVVSRSDSISLGVGHTELSAGATTAYTPGWSAIASVLMSGFYFV